MLITCLIVPKQQNLFEQYYKATCGSFRPNTREFKEVFYMKIGRTFEKP